MKEAINLDTRHDKATHGLAAVIGSSTGQNSMLIMLQLTNNVFDGVTTSGVGTQKYSQNSNGENVYHRECSNKE